MSDFASPVMQFDSAADAPSGEEVLGRLLEGAQDLIAAELTNEEQIAIVRGGPAAQKARELIEKYVDTEHLKHMTTPSLGQWPAEDTFERVWRNIYGLGPVSVLLEQEDVEDIAINGPNEICVRTKSGWQQVSQDLVRELGGSQTTVLFQYNRAISKSGQAASAMKPIIDDQLPSGDRVNIVTQPVTADGVWPVVVIRRHRPVSFTMQDFIESPVKAPTPTKYKINDYVDVWDPNSFLTPASSAFLQMCVLSGLNILLLGRTGVGKTAFLSMLGQLIPSDRRVLVLEDTRELRLRPGATPQNCVYLTTVRQRLEGGIKIDMSDLVITALRQRPDHLILGEARGPEMWDLVNAMQTGHGGNLTSIHANSPKDIVKRVKYMISLPPVEVRMDPREVAELVGSSFHVAISILMDHNHRRFVNEISAFTGNVTDDNNPEIELLFSGGRKDDYRMTLMKESTALEEEFNHLGLSYDEVVDLARREGEKLDELGLTKQS